MMALELPSVSVLAWELASVWVSALVSASKLAEVLESRSYLHHLCNRPAQFLRHPPEGLDETMR